MSDKLYLMSYTGIRGLVAGGTLKNLIAGAIMVILISVVLIVLPVSALTKPAPDFIANASTGNAPLGVQFIDESANSPTLWIWSFGDGGTSNNQNPTHTFAYTGKYTITLTATNSAGSGTVTKAGFITVTSYTQSPDASLVSNATAGTLPFAVQFLDNSTNSPTSWTWSFGDGGTSSEQNPSHTYSVAGIYTVTLTATNSGGSDTVTRVGYITVTKPAAAPIASFFSTVQSGSSPLTVQFLDASTNSPSSWVWSFGDGGTSALQNPLHIYNSAGTYAVTLTVTNSVGSDTVSKSGYITAQPSVPITSFMANVTSGYAPLYVQFADNSTNSPTSWDWSFGDSGTSNLQNPIYVYNHAGTYVVQLTSANSVGSNTSTISNFITVTTLSAPFAAFSSDITTGTTPLIVQFTDNSTNSPSSWLWTFGDGSTSTAQNPSHTYIGAGSYTVSLTAINSAGSRTTTSPGYVAVTSASAPLATTAAYARVTTVQTPPATPESTTGGQVATTAVVPEQASGGSSAILPAIGIVAAAVVCVIVYLLFRRPPRGSRGSKRQEL